MSASKILAAIAIALAVVATVTAPAFAGRRHPPGNQGHKGQPGAKKKPHPPANKRPCSKRPSCKPPCKVTGTCHKPPCKRAGTCKPPCKRTHSCKPGPGVCEGGEETGTCPEPDCEETGTCPEPDCEETGTCPEPDCEETGTCPEPDCEETGTCAGSDCEEPGACDEPPDEGTPVAPAPPPLVADSLGFHTAEALLATGTRRRAGRCRPSKSRPGGFYTDPGPGWVLVSARSRPCRTGRATGVLTAGTPVRVIREAAGEFICKGRLYGYGSSTWLETGQGWSWSGATTTARWVRC